MMEKDFYLESSLHVLEQICRTISDKLTVYLTYAQTQSGPHLSEELADTLGISTCSM